MFASATRVLWRQAAKATCVSEGRNEKKNSPELLSGQLEGADVGVGEALDEVLLDTAGGGNDAVDL